MPLVPLYHVGDNAYCAVCGATYDPSIRHTAEKCRDTLRLMLRKSHGALSILLGYVKECDEEFNSTPSQARNLADVVHAEYLARYRPEENTTPRMPNTSHPRRETILDHMFVALCTEILGPNVENLPQDTELTLRRASERVRQFVRTPAFSQVCSSIAEIP